MKDFIQALDEAFLLNADPEIKVGKEAYMRNKFAFHGILAPHMKEIAKPFLLKAYLPVKGEMAAIVMELWNRPEREYQYFAQEFAFKYIGFPEKGDIELYEFMVTHKSWWDTVDFIANKLIGSYFKRYPEKIKSYSEKWLRSENIWLQRSAVIFQLKYKEKTDTEVLEYAIRSLRGSKEFFINKAIGWALREYGKTNPDWVMDFVENAELSNLSKREALRIIQS